MVTDPLSGHRRGTIPVVLPLVVLRLWSSRSVDLDVSMANGLALAGAMAASAV
jgi:hypothetical protein